MNRKQFAILLVALVVLGAAGLTLYQRGKTSWQTGGSGLGRKLLGDLPVNDVAQITIKSRTNELTLARKDDRWRVGERNDYPANFAIISGFLLKAADLKAVRTEDVGPSQLGRYQLLPPGPGTNTGTLVELKDAGGKTLQSLLLGKPHLRKAGRGAAADPFGGESESSDGRYVMAGAGAKEVALIADPLGDMEVKPEQWLNKDFFKVEKPRLISVGFPNATNSWKLTRETESGDWKLAEAKAGEELDSTKTSGVSSPLSSPGFTDVLPAGAASAGLDPATVVTVETFDNFTYTVRVGGKTNEQYGLAMTVAADLPKERTPGKDEKPEDKEKLDKEFKDRQAKLQEKLKQEKEFEKWVYLVSSWTVDPLLKERAQLLTDKKEEKKDEATATGSMPELKLPEMEKKVGE